MSNFSSESAVEVNDSIDKEEIVLNTNIDQTFSECELGNSDIDKNVVVSDSVKLRFRNRNGSKQSSQQPQVCFLS